MSNPFARMGIVRMPGSSLIQGWGYHDLPFPEYADAPAHRKGTAGRVRHMTDRMNFLGLRGLDIGCSAGGISFGLQMAGAWMTGIDSDPAAIGAAQAIERDRKTGAIFECCRAPSARLSEILSHDFHFGVWFSTFMWVADAVGHEAAEAELAKVARACPVLWFETAERPGDGSAGGIIFDGPEDVRAMLLRHYADVTDTGTPAPGSWFERKVFLCKM